MLIVYMMYLYITWHNIPCHRQPINFLLIKRVSHRILYYLYIIKFQSLSMFDKSLVTWFIGFKMNKSFFNLKWINIMCVYYANIYICFYLYINNKIKNDFLIDGPPLCISKKKIKNHLKFSGKPKMIDMINVFLFTFVSIVRNYIYVGILISKL